MVGIETSAAAANSSCDQAKSERAALTWRIDTFCIDFFSAIYDTFSIDKDLALPPFLEENQRCLHLVRLNTQDWSHGCDEAQATLAILFVPRILGFTEPDSRAAAIFFNESDSGCLERLL
jgi:hypothetical protein